MDFQTFTVYLFFSLALLAVCFYLLLTRGRSWLVSWSYVLYKDHSSFVLPCARSHDNERVVRSVRSAIVPRTQLKRISVTFITRPRTLI